MVGNSKTDYSILCITAHVAIFYWDAFSHKPTPTVIKVHLKLFLVTSLRVEPDLPIVWGTIEQDNFERLQETNLLYIDSA